MSDSFEALKKNKGTNALADKLNQVAGNNSNNYKDERIWKPEPDKNGNYSGVIRFLPEAKGEETPFIKTYNHGFKKNGKWFIENCPTTIGLPCPVCETNGELWNAGDDESKKVARDRKRKVSYYCNILVVNDTANPENNGKRFLYRFGTKIMEKIEAAVEGDPAVGQEGVNVTDFWEGANFVVKMRKGDGGFTTYQDSQFQQKSALFDGDDNALRALWESLYSLQEFHDPSNFKSYDDLSNKFTTFTQGRNSQFTAESVSAAPSAPAPSSPTPQDFNPHQTAPTIEAPSIETPSAEEAPFKAEMRSGGGSEPSKSPYEMFKDLQNG